MQQVVDLGSHRPSRVRLSWVDGDDRLDLDREFKFEKVLGKGNSSTVHKAYDKKLESTVAVKILEKANVKESYLREML